MYQSTMAQGPRSLAATARALACALAVAFATALVLAAGASGEGTATSPSSTPPPPPANDTLAGAQAIRSLPASINGTTVGASTEPGERESACSVPTTSS